MDAKSPEEEARAAIDAALAAAGWAVQDASAANPTATIGVAVREFPLMHGHGYADYLLYVGGKAAGVIEAKKVGTTLTGVEVQAEKYATGLPADIPAHLRPLPFLYQSTGAETRFTSLLDPEPRSRRVYHFHRPETLKTWLEEEPIYLPLRKGKPDPLSLIPASFRNKLRAMPSVIEKGLWRVQTEAIRNLEVSLAEDRPRALVQMIMGSGKTVTAVTAAYRLVKFADARRVLFLVDRANLGRQALKEFQHYTTPDDGRKFTELYNVQHLTSNRIDPVARVVVTTIQRLYSMLRGEPDLDPAVEEGSQYDTASGLVRDPVAVAYSPVIPVEFFDVIFVDECHRSIYSLWRQVLEYFDAHLVGLTATPSKQTFGFFNQNVVMEYGHEQAVADGVNVDFEVYEIKTKITEGGSTVESGPFETIARRNRETRAVRWEKLDDDLTYDADALDRSVVAIDQLRTVVQTFKEKLFTDIFPGRTSVPKTLIYAKDDSHADDIVQVVREVFGKGNEFAEKITYRTGTARVVTKKLGADGREVEEVTYKSTGVKAEDLLSSFRNSFNPRIVVTVDMIATGTDIKPLEVVMFMRAVKSRNFFEQMKGRGVRVISEADFQSVTPDAPAKTHFVIVDGVGIFEQNLHDSYLRVANVYLDRIDLSDVNVMDFDAEDFPKYRLIPDDILLSEGQSPELVGRSAIYRGGVHGLCFQKTLHRFRRFRCAPRAQFCQTVFRAYLFGGTFRKVASQTVNIAHLTLERLKPLHFPLPPAAEQERIVTEVERLLSVVDEVAATIETDLRRAERLRHAILKLAIEGRLVPQDPTDEPASALLERLRREREARDGEAKPPRAAGQRARAKALRSMG